MYSNNTIPAAALYEEIALDTALDTKPALSKSRVLDNVFDALNPAFNLPPDTDIEQRKHPDLWTFDTFNDAPRSAVFFDYQYFNDYEAIVCGMFVAMAEAAGWPVRDETEG